MPNTIRIALTRIALAVAIVALGAISIADTASAFPRGFGWRAVPLYGIPM